MPIQQSITLQTDSASTKTVAFRLASQHMQTLSERADAAGVSPGKLARQIVVAALTDQSEVVRLRSTILELDEKVSHLHRDLTTATEAILVTVVSDDKPTVQEAKQWVMDKLRTD